MRLAEHKYAAELALAEGPRFNHAREHIAREHAALCIRSPEITGRRITQVGVNFIVRRSDIKLGIAPEGIFRKKRTISRVCDVGVLPLCSRTKEQVRENP